MRRGLTLIELLVVIAIVVTITAAAIPMMAPGVESRKLRESARSLSVTLATARAKAAASGRTVGVDFRPTELDNRVCVMASIVESRPPYSGDTTDAVATVRITNSTPPANGVYYLTAELTGLNPFMVSEGDTVKFNYQGHLYQVTGVSNDTLALTVNAKGGRLPWAAPYNSVTPQPVAYTIYGRPRPDIRTGAAMQLAGGIVVDMRNSGEGLAGTFPTPAPIAIMFGAGGQVESIVDSAGSHRPTGTTYLHIGRAENVGAQNLADLDTLWIAVSQHGNTYVAPNAKGGSLAEHRSLAADARHTVGGR